MVKAVEAGESDEPAPTARHGEEDLQRRVVPYLQQTN